MNDGQVHEISEKIGALKASVEIMTDLWKTQEASASAGRRALHDKFEAFKDDMGTQVAGLSLRVDRVVDKLTDLEPMAIVAAKIKEEELRDEGAKRLGLRLWGALVVAATAVGYICHELISYLRHP